MYLTRKEVLSLAKVIDEYTLKSDNPKFTDRLKSIKEKLYNNITPNY